VLDGAQQAGEGLPKEKQMADAKKLLTLNRESVK